MNKANREYYRKLGGKLRTVYCSLDVRCNNPDHPRYHNYGGRGIKNKFKNFKAFYDYVVNELGYDTIESLRGLQIHRIINDPPKGYEPGNIEFLSPLMHAQAHVGLRRVAKNELDKLCAIGDK